MSQQQLSAPYIIFLGDAKDFLMAKVAKGMVHWRPEKCIAQMRLPAAKVNLGLPDMTMKQAVAAGAKTFILGLAPMGGTLPSSWCQSLRKLWKLG